MLRTTLTALAISLACAVSTPALAQAICGERTVVLKQLGESHREAPSAHGLASNGTIVEILTSDKGTWTIVMTRPDGVTCLMAAGEHWEQLKRVAMGPSA